MVAIEGRAQRRRAPAIRSSQVPAVPLFVVSAVFHYLGPSLAVLLFTRVNVLGVAWLRVMTAAVVFAIWRRPWRLIRLLTAGERRAMLALGLVLAAMNSTFYLAIARLPLATVGAIEFVGTVAVAAAGIRTGRNVVALALAVTGVAVLSEVRLVGEPVGFALAFANCALFMIYVMLAHHIATTAQRRGSRTSGVDRLAAAMGVAAIVITPVGVSAATPAFTDVWLLLAGAGVGLCSSVIPYVIDQLAMARLPRATYALLLALLPVVATVMGAAVLHQWPTAADLAGISCVVAGVAFHHDGSAVNRRCGVPASRAPGQ